MTDIDGIKTEMKRLFVAGDKEEFLQFLENALGQLTDVEGEELGTWFRGLTPGTVVDDAGNAQRTVFDDAENDAFNSSEGEQDVGREGVFVHSFKCRHCGLHFQTFSWMANRHKAGTVVCPECSGERLGHWRATVNQRKESGSRGTEISDLFPYPDSNEMADSWTSE